MKQKKMIGILLGLVAVVAVVGWVWPKSAQPQYGQLFLQEFQRFIEPLCKGEEAQYEILDRNGQDITQQVKQAVQKDVEKRNWNSAAQTAFSMADSMMYRNAVTPDDNRMRFLVAFASKAAAQDGKEECQVLWMLESTLEQDESGLFMDSGISEATISGVQVWPKGRLEGDSGNVQIASDGKSATLFGNLSIVGGEKEEITYENVHGEVVLYPLAQ